MWVGMAVDEGDVAGKDGYGRLDSGDCVEATSGVRGDVRESLALGT